MTTKKSDMKNKLLTTALLLSLTTSQGLLAQWQVTSGPAQPNVISVATSATNTFAAAGSAVSLTPDNGTNWTLVSNGLVGTINCVATKGTDVFAGASGGAVFQSSNNGSGWTNTSTGLPSYDIRSFTVNGTDLYAATYGVYKSTNNGLQWTQFNQGWYDLVFSIAVKEDTILASTKNTGIHLTSDNGANWNTINTGLPLQVNAVTIVGTTFFAGTNDGLYISTNGGSSWSITSITNAIGSFTKVGNNVFAGGSGGGGVFLSTDSGASWTAINAGLSNLTVYSLATNDTYVFAGTTGYVFKRLLSEVLPLTTSIQEQQNDFLSIYPNPSIGKFTITADKICSVKIYNSIGQFVLTKENLSGQTELNLNESGTYLLVIQEKITNKFFNKQIIIQ